MTYEDVSLMLRGIADALEDGDVMVRSDDRAQLTIGFRVDRPGTEAHSVTLMTVKMRKGVTEDVEGLIATGRGRDMMALALTHRHPFVGHGCEECSVWEVMES